MLPTSLNELIKGALVELAIVAYNDKVEDQRIRSQRLSSIGNMLARASVTAAAGLADFRNLVSKEDQNNHKLIVRPRNSLCLSGCYKLSMIPGFKKAKQCGALQKQSNILVFKANENFLKLPKYNIIL